MILTLHLYNLRKLLDKLCLQFYFEVWCHVGTPFLSLLNLCQCASSLNQVYCCLLGSVSEYANLSSVLSQTQQMKVTLRRGMLCLHIYIHITDS